VAASSNVTPCLTATRRAFFGSHSNSRSAMSRRHHAIRRPGTDSLCGA
jgi:hypothetical protein